MRSETSDDRPQARGGGEGEGGMSDQIQIIVPGRDDDAISNSLRRLTEKIHKARLSERAVCGIFGGEWGYGTDYENDVFEMHWDRQHPRCRCGASRPKHLDTCARSEERVGEWISDRLTYAHEKMGNPCSFADLGNGFERFQAERPFPSCSCGEEFAWRARNPGIEPNDDDDGFEEPHPSDFTHARDCDWSVLYRPNFTHKPSGSTVRWYKYIGRSMKCDLTADWHVIIRECMESIRIKRSRKGAGR